MLQPPIFNKSFLRLRNSTNSLLPRAGSYIISLITRSFLFPSGMPITEFSFPGVDFSLHNDNVQLELSFEFLSEDILSREYPFLCPHDELYITLSIISFQCARASCVER